MRLLWIVVGSLNVKRILSRMYWLDTEGWYNFLQPGTRDIFSGRQMFLTGDIAHQAIQRITDAMVQFIRYRKPHHTGELEFPQYLRSEIREDFGGVAPVALFVVPDIFMDYYTPTWNLKFQFQHAIHLDGDLNERVPEELKASPYYQEFLQARQRGFPLVPQDAIPSDISVSELDIDIQFAYVHFPGLEMHGGRVSSVVHLLSNFGGVAPVALFVVPDIFTDIC